MGHRFFIGDKVRTIHGIGWVRRVTTWRDRILEMDDYEAREFSANCKRICGVNYKEDWVELLVEVNKRLFEFQASVVTLLEGREYDSTRKLEKKTIKIER